MKPDVEILNKEFTSNNGLITLSRADYYSFPIPLEASQFDDDEMQELVDTIATRLKRDYRITKEELDNENNQEVLWELIETIALDMGMEYCDEVAKQKEQELFDLVNESIAVFNEDNYLQFEKSIVLDKTTYPEYDWIDGVQLVDEYVVVWVSTENSEDIFCLDVELFDSNIIDEMINALKETIKNLLKKS